MGLSVKQRAEHQDGIDGGTKFQEQYTVTRVSDPHGGINICSGRD